MFIYHLQNINVRVLFLTMLQAKGDNISEWGQETALFSKVVKWRYPVRSETELASYSGWKMASPTSYNRVSKSMFFNFQK